VSITGLNHTSFFKESVLLVGNPKNQFNSFSQNLYNFVNILVLGFYNQNLVKNLVNMLPLNKINEGF
jgi:hypothetical protein